MHNNSYAQKNEYNLDLIYIIWITRLFRIMSSLLWCLAKAALVPSIGDTWRIIKANYLLLKLSPWPPSKMRILLDVRYRYCSNSIALILSSIYYLIPRFYKPSRTKNHLYFFLEYCQQDLKSYVASKGGRLS